MDILVTILLSVGIIVLASVIYRMNSKIFGAVLAGYMSGLVAAGSGLSLIIFSTEYFLSREYASCGLFAFVGVSLLFWGISLIRKAYRS